MLPTLVVMDDTEVRVAVDSDDTSVLPAPNMSES